MGIIGYDEYDVHDGHDGYDMYDVHDGVMISYSCWISCVAVTTSAIASTNQTIVWMVVVMVSCDSTMVCSMKGAEGRMLCY